MSNESINFKDPKVGELLEKFSKSREELSKYMTDVDTIRQKVDQIFPTNQDFRNKWALEEKIKAVSSFYSTLLNIRQEFNKTIKEEIDIRRKISDNNEGGEEGFNIRDLAKLVEDSQKEKKEEPSSEPSLQIQKVS